MEAIMIHLNVFNKCESQWLNGHKCTSWESQQSESDKGMATDGTMKNNARAIWYNSKEVFWDWIKDI